MSITNKKVIFIGGSILAVSGLAWLLNKGSAIKNLEILVSDVKIALKNTAIGVNLELLVKNPSSELLQFLSFTGNMYSDGQPIGTIDVSKPVNILPKSETPVPLDSVVPINNIAATLFNVLTTQKLPTNGVLKGVVTLSGGITVPVFYTFVFSSPTSTAATATKPAGTSVSTKTSATAPIPNTITKTVTAPVKKNILTKFTSLFTKKTPAQKAAKKTAKALKKTAKRA